MVWSSGYYGNFYDFYGDSWATVTPVSPSTGDSVTFTSTSTDPDGQTVTQAWDLDNDGQFNDGNGTTAHETDTLSKPTYLLRSGRTVIGGGHTIPPSRISTRRGNAPAIA